MGLHACIWRSSWVRVSIRYICPCQAILTSISQTISGAIIENISFEATFGISALIFIPILALMYFIVVETTYNGARGTKIEIEEKGSFWSVDVEEKETYGQKLRLFRGRLSNDSFWKGAWKPVPLIAYPAVLFSTIVYGSYFTWLLTISVLSVTAFSAPPYNLGPAQIGLTNLPLLVVGLIGSPLSGWLADFVAKSMAKRNNGVFEPEFRLTLMAIATPLATAGFLGFGMSVQNGAPLVYPILFMSIHSLSVPFASQASLTYVIDCHPKDANQAFVTINFTKAVFTFLATTYANGWFARVGPRGVFDAITLINLGVCALTIPAYIFGKRFRGLVSLAFLWYEWRYTNVGYNTGCTQQFRPKPFSLDLCSRNHDCFMIWLTTTIGLKLGVIQMQYKNFFLYRPCLNFCSTLTLVWLEVMNRIRCPTPKL